MTDRSNGYEGVAAEFLAGRGSARTRSKGIGVRAVREWARTLPRRGAVIDLGLRAGVPHNRGPAYGRSERLCDRRIAILR